MDRSLPDSSVHGIFQARILEWIAMPSSRGSSQPRDKTCFSYVCISMSAGGFFTTSNTYYSTPVLDLFDSLESSEWASLMAQLVKNLPAMQETWVQFLDWEDPQEKEMST